MLNFVNCIVNERRGCIAEAFSRWLVDESMQVLGGVTSVAPPISLNEKKSYRGLYINRLSERGKKSILRRE
jgi:hypothetical protein